MRNYRHGSPSYPKNLFNSYIQSDSWKCSKSPVNAHQWRLDIKSQTCVYCGEVRIFPKTEKIDIFRNYSKRIFVEHPKLNNT